jgi:5-epi-alpha-selinene synthase
MLNIKYPALYCPFPSPRNQHAEAAGQHSFEWARSFNLVTDESAWQFWRVAQLHELIARTYPHASLESLKITCDFMWWIFIFDDQCEEAGTSKQPELLEPEHARLVDISKGASLTDFDTPAALSWGDIQQRLHQFQHCTSEWRLTWAKNMEDYFQGVRWEALNHSQGITPDLANYMKIRVFSIGSYPCYDLIRIVDRIALGPEVTEHPIVKRLELAVTYVICWSNDILSLKKDVRQGKTHNLALVLQSEYQISLQEAVERAASLHDAEVRTFIELSSQLPSFGTQIDATLQRYLSGLRSWLCGHLDWAQESGRYRLTETTLADIVCLSKS